MPNLLRRNPLQNIIGFAGGSLGDQLNRDKNSTLFSPIADPLQDRRKQMMELMKNAPLQTSESPTQQPVLKPDPQIENLPRIHIGAATKGLEGADDLSKENLPSINVSESPSPEKSVPHGFKGRLLTGLRTAIIGMGDVAKNNPNADAAELLSAGATGGGIGAISPRTGQSMLDRIRAQAAQQDEARQLGIEGQRADIESAKARPALEAERVKRDEEYKQAQLEVQRAAAEGRISREEADRKLKELSQSEQIRHNREMERLGQEKLDKPPVVRESKAEPDYSQRKEWYYKKQKEAESAAKDLRQQAEAITISTADDQTRKDDLFKRATEAEKNALGYRDKGDEAATMPQSLAPKSGPVKPAKDGKYYYTLEQIRVSAGDNFDEVYAKLKANPKVVIDE